MNAKSNTRTFVPFFVLAILFLVSLACVGTLIPPDSGTSPDGRFQAQFIQAIDSIKSAYVVTEISTGKVVLITYSEYKTPNDVKAAIFSNDSKKFAAAYHYSHQGNYTWVGVWNTETGEFLYSETIDGFTTNISSVFDR